MLRLKWWLVQHSFTHHCLPTDYWQPHEYSPTRSWIFTVMTAAALLPLPVLSTDYCQTHEYSPTQSWIFTVVAVGQSRLVKILSVISDVLSAFTDRFHCYQTVFRMSCTNMQLVRSEYVWYSTACQCGLCGDLLHVHGWVSCCVCWIFCVCLVYFVVYKSWT